MKEETVNNRKFPPKDYFRGVSFDGLSESKQSTIRILLKDSIKTIENLLSEMNHLDQTNDTMCDHDVGVCWCKWHSQIESAKEILAKLKTVSRDLGQDINRTIHYP